MLGGTGRKVYIGLMHSPLRPTVQAGLLVALAAAWPLVGQAQGFTANYDLARAAAQEQEGAGRSILSAIGNLHLAPAFHTEGSFSGAGLSLAAGQNWFAQVTVGRSVLAPLAVAPNAAADSMQLGGGYRWSDGQSLSLHVTGARGAGRLGLALRYDWPQYYLRLSLDPRMDIGPVDTLRFSAGVRF